MLAHSPLISSDLCQEKSLIAKGTPPPHPAPLSFVPAHAVNSPGPSVRPVLRRHSMVLLRRPLRASRLSGVILRRVLKAPSLAPQLALPAASSSSPSPRSRSQAGTSRQSWQEMCDTGEEFGKRANSSFWNLSDLFNSRSIFAQTHKSGHNNN